MFVGAEEDVFIIAAEASVVPENIGKIGVGIIPRFIGTSEMDDFGMCASYHIFVVEALRGAANGIFNA